jgi:hypothetical protein
MTAKQGARLPAATLFSMRDLMSSRRFWAMALPLIICADMLEW